MAEIAIPKRTIRRIVREEVKRIVHTYLRNQASLGVITELEDNIIRAIDAWPLEKK